MSAAGMVVIDADRLAGRHDSVRMVAGPHPPGATLDPAALLAAADPGWRARPVVVGPERNTANSRRWASSRRLLIGVHRLTVSSIRGEARPRDEG
jgi:hypothetical protein